MKAPDNLVDHYHRCQDLFYVTDRARGGFGGHETWESDDPIEVSAEGVTASLDDLDVFFSTAYRKQTAPTRSETKRSVDDRAQIDALEGRVRKLEAQVATMQRAEGRAARVEAEEEAAVSPHTRWIEAHLDELRTLPSAWVVLDAEKGIVFRSADESRLAAKLEEYAPEDGDRLMIFHTSMYV